MSSPGHRGPTSPASLRATAVLGAVTTASALTAALAASTGLRRRLSHRRSLLPGLRSPGVFLAADVLSPELTAAQVRAADARRGETRVVAGVDVLRTTATGPDGLRVPVEVHRPASTLAHRPGVALWLHDGGHVGGGVGPDRSRAGTLARDAGAVVVAVDHRLAPEHPYPADLDDAFAALLWVLDRADELDVDPTRVAVVGAGAGGGLAAALALRAHDAGIALALQVLIQPMLDDRTAEAAARGGRGLFGWTARHNVGAWDAYLGRPGAGEHVPALAAPARREDLTGVAPAWVGVGGLDLFLEEALTYASRLEAAGVPVGIHVVEGMYHGADVDHPEHPHMAAFTESWTAAVRSALAARDA